ncbi:MAG TPA: hypothetical protein PKV44_05295 [Bacillota bacterium]|nr:hypothetical protein [Bacillota bacterium]HPE38212.1 hypothetical protein [Bacillota bacterium]
MKRVFYFLIAIIVVVQLFSFTACGPAERYANVRQINAIDATSFESTMTKHGYRLVEHDLPDANFVEQWDARNDSELIVYSFFRYESAEEAQAAYDWLLEAIQQAKQDSEFSGSVEFESDPVDKLTMIGEFSNFRDVSGYHAIVVVHVEDTVLTFDAKTYNEETKAELDAILLEFNYAPL